MVDPSTYDVAVVAVVPSEHYPVALEQVRMGKRVVIEKPLCLDPGHAEALAASFLRPIPGSQLQGCRFARHRFQLICALPPAPGSYEPARGAAKASICNHARVLFSRCAERRSFVSGRQCDSARSAWTTMAPKLCLRSVCDRRLLGDASANSVDPPHSKALCVPS